MTYHIGRRRSKTIIREVTVCSIDHTLLLSWGESFKCDQVVCNIGIF